MRRRFWVEAITGCCGAASFIATLRWPDWIERSFGVDLDHGSGGVEWLIVAVLGLATVTAWVLARTEWRRAHLVTPAGGQC